MPAENERIARSAVSAVLLALEGGADELTSLAVIRGIIGALPQDVFDDGPQPVRMFIDAIREVKGTFEVVA